MSNAVQKRFDELGWTSNQYEVINPEDYEEAMKRFHRVKDDLTIKAEEIDVSDRSLDEIKQSFQKLAFGEERFSILWPYERFGAKIKLKNFVEDLDSLWYPSQDDVVFIGEDSAVLMVLDHEEKLEIRRW